MQSWFGRTGGKLTILALAGCCALAVAGPVRAQDTRCATVPDLDAVRAEHLTKLNGIRIRAGVKELVPDARLDDAAQAYACLLARTGHFDHIGPGGTAPDDRARAVGYKFCGVAENLAKGQQSVEQVLIGWVRSPGHLENLRRKGMSDIGFGVAFVTDVAAVDRTGPGSLSELAQSLDGRPRDAILPTQNYVWVEMFGAPC